MLRVIGGAARSGKTIVARRLLEEHGVPYFCVDYFVSALDRGAPELGIEAESPSWVRAEALWPRIEPMLRNIVEVEPEYTVDGDALLPRGVALLQETYGDRVGACFLGYASSTPERKLTEIRAFAGGVNDWIRDKSDSYVLALAREMIDFSEYIRRECATFGIPYFDVSDDFEGALRRAYSAIAGPPVPPPAP